MINFFRFFEMTDLLEFERMTVREYSIRMLAFRLKNLDKQEMIHQQAWANWQVQSTRTRGKKEEPVYKSFDRFFNKQKLENEVLGIDTSNFKAETDKKLMRLLKDANT